MSQLLLTKLAAVKRKHATVSVASALAGATGLFVLALAAGMLLDWWLELGTTSRIVLLAIYIAGVVSILVRYAILPLIFAPDVEQAALWVERDEPGFCSRLISAVQFMQPEAVSAGMSRSMVQVMMRETESIAEPLDFTTVIKTDSLTHLIALLPALPSFWYLAFVCMRAEPASRCWNGRCSFPESRFRGGRRLIASARTSPSPAVIRSRSAQAHRG